MNKMQGLPHASQLLMESCIRSKDKYINDSRKEKGSVKVDQLLSQILRKLWRTCKIPRLLTAIVGQLLSCKDYLYRGLGNEWT